MNPERLYAPEIRRRAEEQLPPDFARMVLAAGDSYRHRRERNRITALTTAVCLGIALVTHYVMTTHNDRRNLEQWSKAAQQVSALEQTI